MTVVSGARSGEPGAAESKVVDGRTADGRFAPASVASAQEILTSRAILRALRKHIVFIASVALTGFLLAFASLVVKGPQYEANSIIQFNFNSSHPAAGQQVATLDAQALVDGAVRLMRSRAVALAVVSRLKLDERAEFTRPSRILTAVSRYRAWLGLEDPVVTPKDIAATEVLRLVIISHEPRSYLITVAFDARERDLAIAVSDAFATEIVAIQAQQRLAASLETARRELGELSPLYGPQHPLYAGALAKVQQVRAQYDALAQGHLSPAALAELGGLSFKSADAVTIPSWPNPAAFLLAAVLLSVLIGMGLVMAIEWWTAQAVAGSVSARRHRSPA